MKKNPKIILLNETVWQSVVKDTFTVAVLWGSVGLGIWAGSGALQCIGGIMFILWLINRADGEAKAGRMTIAQARAFLDALEAEQREATAAA